MASQHEAYLRNALTRYQYADIAKREIMGCITQYTDIRPKLDTFVFNDGLRKELLCLDGTIPVNYKGATYNIPLVMWLMDTHPYNPPMVFVKPTSTMQIKQGRHVDANGKVYLPYLHDWKHPQSDLLGLIQILVIVFGDEPPVFSRTSNAARTYPAQNQSNTPYPTANTAMPSPYNTGAGGYQPPTTGGAYPPQQQYPRYPGAGPYPAAQPVAAPQSSPYPNTGYPPQAAPTQQQSYNAGYPPQNAAYQGASAGSTGTLSEEHIKASLLSAVEDKMRRRLRDIFSTAQAEMDSLKKTQEDLNKGKQSLDTMMQRLEQEQNDVDRNLTLLKEKDEEMEQILRRMENSQEVTIDDSISPTTPLYRQLLNAFAEEQSTEDAIYYLGEALRRGVLELEVFLKQVRELSRKQFMLRALIHKCRQKAGLPELRG